MSVGIEVPAIAKLLTPLITELVKGAKGAVVQGFARWTASDFPRKLAKKLATADKIKTIWSPEKEVSLLSIYYPSHITFDSELRLRVNSLSDLMDGNIVIEGIVGHGKSIFLRYLYLQELAGQGKGVLPLFIELRTISAKKSLDMLIMEALAKLEISGTEETFDYLARSGKIVLMLDGFDEIDDENVSDSVNKLEFLSEKYDNMQIVVTSRPSNEIQKSRHFSKIKISGLGPDDYFQFLTKLGVKKTRVIEIIEAIGKSPSDVADLINTPLMLTLLVMVYESEGSIPSEIPEFFSKLFSTMFSRHDHLKAGFRRKHFSGLSESKLQTLFETFCFSATNQGYGRSLEPSQFINSFDLAIERMRNTACDCENFKKDITKVSCLMLNEGFEHTTFLHKSIMEYFSAAFIQKSNQDFAQKFYRKSIVKYTIWDSTLTFLEKIDDYRFCKFYIHPTHNEFLDDIDSASSKDMNLDLAKDLLVKMFPLYVITYMPDNSSILRERYYQRMWGPFGMQGPNYGGRIRNEIIRALNDGIEEDLPHSLSLEELMEAKSGFIRKEQGGDIIFQLPLKTALEKYEVKNLELKLKILEQTVWRRLRYAEDLIEAEDRKTEMIDDDDAL